MDAKAKAVDATESLLDFGLGLRFEDLPAGVVERTRLAILDTLGATIAGTVGEGVPALAALVADWGGSAQATALPGEQQVPLPLAGLLNGVAARAWDLDDVHEQNTCHINANVVPAAIALAEAQAPIGGTELITAITVGAETVCRLSSAPRISFSETGSSMSYQCGFYGAALVAARLLGLSRDAARHALGIAHARVAGNQQGYIAGAMTVRLMQGVAVEGGLLSALMAQRGLTGSSEVFEGQFGYFPVYHRGRYEREALVDGLGGKRWLMLEPSIKPAYPCCKYTHGPIEAAAQVMRELGAAAQEIERVRVRVTNREVHDLVCLSRERKWNPQSLTDAQFSLPFTVAHALVHGSVGFQTFGSEGLADQEVRRLLPRIEIDLDLSGQGDGRGTFPMPGIVSVSTRDGRYGEARVDLVKGHPGKPMAFDDVASKFLACAAFGRPRWRGAERVIDAVRNLESIDDAGVLARLCLENR